MPRKKTARIEPEEELLVEEVEVIELDEDEQRDDDSHRNGGLDLYDGDGNLLEEGEPTYIEEDEEED